MTYGREWTTILFFALPIMGSDLLQALYNLADGVIVGNFIGPAALGAIGITAPMMWLLLSFCASIGTGTSIVVAQLYGAGRQEDIRASVRAAYALSLMVGLSLMLLCFVLARPLVWNFLAAPAEMRETSVLYFRIYAAGLLFQMFYNVTYGILRAHGDSRGGLFFLMIAAVLNVLMDFLAIVVLGWGVAGAAIATIFSQACCAVASMLYLVCFFPELRVGFSIVSIKRVDPGKVLTIVKVASPIVAQAAILSIGFAVMQRFVNAFGRASIEGYTSMCKIEELAHIPSNGFYSAVSAFVGQNIGAGKIARAKRGYRAALKMGGVITLVIAIGVGLFSEQMLTMFNISGESLRRGWEHLILLMIFIPVMMTANITSGFLQGSGDVRIPAVASFANLSVRLVGTYLMADTFIDFRSVYASMPFAWITGCLIVLLRYRSGRWRGAKLV